MFEVITPELVSLLVGIVATVTGGLWVKGKLVLKDSEKYLEIAETKLEELQDIVRYLNESLEDNELTPEEIRTIVQKGFKLITF